MRRNQFNWLHLHVGLIYCANDILAASNYRGVVGVIFIFLIFIQHIRPQLFLLLEFRDMTNVYIIKRNEASIGKESHSDPLVRALSFVQTRL